MASYFPLRIKKGNLEETNTTNILTESEREDLNTYYYLDNWYDGIWEKLLIDSPYTLKISFKLYLNSYS